jgi:pimeloyl-ACP methyl ester carboxylesterase
MSGLFGDERVAPPGALPGTAGWDDAAGRGRAVDRSRSQALQRGVPPATAATARTPSPPNAPRAATAPRGATAAPRSGTAPRGATSTTPVPDRVRTPVGFPIDPGPRRRNPLLRVVFILLRIVTVLVLLVLLGSALANQLTTRPGVTPQSLYAGPYAEIDGRSVAYARWGETGTPIVLIPGFLESTSTFDKVGPLLAARGYRVYSLDLPGFGYTERKGPYGLKASIAVTEAFIRQVVGGKPLLVGHSSGSSVAAGVGLDDSQLAAGIVMLDGDARDFGGPTWLRSVLARGPILTSTIRLLSRVDPLTDAIIRRVYAPAHVEVDAAERARWTDFLKVDGAEGALLATVRSGAQGQSIETLTNLRGQRILVLFGAGDEMLSARTGHEVASATGASFATIAAQGHQALRTKPSRVAGIIDRWFKRKPASSTD